MDFSDVSTVISLPVLVKITDNFSDKKSVGKGAYGEVYKALYNGQEIAVKKIHPLAGLNDEPFDNEFRTLSQIQHQNVVQLIGYCHESRINYVMQDKEIIKATVKERILCFEYMKGGSLEKYIKDDFCDLDWPICYKIIRGACEGLNHLHNELDKTIYHLDLKPANILLDEDLTPKLADLGISRVVNTTKTHHTERLTLQGTLGYMPPEYIDHSDISKKFDVYSLGGVIIRLMDGNKCSTRYSGMGAQEYIKHVMENWERRLQGTSRSQPHKIGILQAKMCLDIALRCVERDRSKRPTIKEIVGELEELEAKIKKMSLDQSKGTVGQTRPDTRVVAADPKELRFLFKPRMDISTCLQLTNLTDGFLAFKIKINQSKYYTQPNKGIMEPCSRCYISVTLRAQEAAPPNMQCNDMFIVESANVHEEFTTDEITEECFQDDQVMAGKVEELPIVYVATN